GKLDNPLRFLHGHRPLMSAPSGFRGGELRPHAFEGVGHGASASNFGARGNASVHRGGGGGGGGFHHGGGGGHHGRWYGSFRSFSKICFRDSVFFFYCGGVRRLVRN